MKLIDKSILVAEINRVLNSYDPNEITSGRYALVDLRNFIDTLEIKKENSMTDKVQKIREEVERLQNELIQEKEKGFGSDIDDACILELQNVLTYIDSLQEESIIVDAPPYNYVKGFSDGRLYEKKQKEEPVSEELGDYINELSKQFPEVSFAKLSRIAVSVSRWQQNQDVKNKQPKVTNRTELDEYAYQCAYDMSNDWMIENPTWHDVEDACKLGANWQKLKDMGITNNAKGLVTNILNSSDKPLDTYATEVAFIMLPANLTENYHMTNRDRISDAVKLGAKWKEKEMQSAIELAEDHAMLAGMVKGKEEAIKKTIDFLNWIIGTGNSTIEEYKKYMSN